MPEPTNMETTVAMSPTRSEILDPQIVSVRTERPRSSVPNGYWRLGGARIGPLEITGSRPLESARTGAKIATAAKKTRMTRPAIPILLLRYVRHVCSQEARRRARAMAFGLRLGERLRSSGVVERSVF